MRRSFSFEDLEGSDERSVIPSRHQKTQIGQYSTAAFDYPDLKSTPQVQPAQVAEIVLEPSFTSAELEAAVAAARKAAEAETEERVRAAIKAEVDQRLAEAMVAIVRQLESAQEQLEAWMRQRAGATRDLALGMARALLPRALAKEPLADIEAMLEVTIRRLDDTPMLECRLPPDLLEVGEVLLRRLAHQVGFTGELQVTPDLALGAGDAVLCWQDGVARRDLGALQKAAFALAEAWLKVPQDDTTSSANAKPGGSAGHE